MANLIIATPVLSDAATFSAGSELTNNPVANLQDQQVTKTWKASTLSSSTYIVVDLGARTTWNFVGLMGTNFGSADKIQVRAASAAASLTAGPGFNTTITAWPAGATTTLGKVNCFLLTAASQTYQHVRIDVSTTGSTAASGFECGRLYISNVFQPTKNAEFGMAFGYQDETRLSKSFGGQTYADTRPKFRVADFTLSFLTQAEAYGLILEMDRTRGVSGDLICILDPAETTYLHQQIVYGRMRELTPLVYVNPSLWEKTYRLEELL